MWFWRSIVSATSMFLQDAETQSFLLLSTRNMESWPRRSEPIAFNPLLNLVAVAGAFPLFLAGIPQVCVYGVAALLWAAARFGLSPDQTLAMPRQLRRLLLEMAKKTPVERPTIAGAKKVCMETFGDDSIPLPQSLHWYYNSVVWVWFGLASKLSADFHPYFQKIDLRLLKKKFNVNVDCNLFKIYKFSCYLLILYWQSGVKQAPSIYMLHIRSYHKVQPCSFSHVISD